MATDLGIPGCGDECLGIELNIKRGPNKYGVSGEVIKPDSAVVAQIPDLGTHKHRRDYSIRHGAGNAAGQFFFPARTDVIRIVRDLRFVEQIGTEIETILNQLEIGVDLEFQLEICDTLAGGFVRSPPFRLR